MISRKLTILAAASLVLGGLTSLSHATDGGGDWICPLGTGQATLGAGLSYFPTVAANVSFTFTVNCSTGGSVTGNGVLQSASCGRSSGSGTFAGSGQAFDVETAGSMLVVTRAGNPTAVIGAANATPVPDTSTIPFSNSCSNGTAKVFQLTGFLCVDFDTGVICPF